MKNIMNKVKAGWKKFLKSESGQGMTEYALLLLIVIALVTIFKKPITEAVQTKVQELSSKIISGEN